MISLEKIFEQLLIKTKQGVNFYGFLAQHDQYQLVKNTALFEQGRIDAALGFAMSGRIEQVNKLIIHEKNLEIKKSLVGSAISGYAFIDDMDAITSFENYREFNKDRIRGFAKAGHKSQVNYMLSNCFTLFDEAINGYASNNQASDLLKQLSGTNRYSQAIKTAAKFGNIELVYKILDTPSLDNESYKNIAAQGFCRGRHFNHAARFLEEGANINLALEQLTVSDKSVTKVLFIMLLMHIKKSKIFNNVVEQIKTKALVETKLSISDTELTAIQKLQSAVTDKQCHYVDACIEIGLVASPTIDDMELLRVFKEFELSQANQKNTLALN